MENPKPMETLEAENPAEEIPKEASGMSDFFSELCPVSVIPDEFGDDENVAVESQVAEEAKPKDSPKFEAEQTEEKGSLVDAEESVAQPDFQESMVVENTEAEDSERLGVEKSCVNEDKVEEEAKPNEENESVEVNNLVRAEEEKEEEEAPIEGISLYVDIRGSPTFDDQASDFSVGDIVWAKSKNQTWWPGKIHDPAKAPKYALRIGHGDDILVGFYGTGQFAWFARPQLKPFHEAFDRVMTGKKRKNKAELVFLVAVERAAEDFGALVKSEMTCSCLSKRGREDLGMKRLGEFSAAEFEPASFLGGLKCVALFGSVARAIDASVARNRLSAFYRSVGHMQLPLYRLADKKGPEEEVEDKSSPKKNKKKGSGDGFASSSRSRKRKTEKVLELNEVEESTPRDKGFESRERKKSKYLSYPYVNFEHRAETGRIENDAPLKSTREDVLASPSIPKNTGEKFWRRWYRQLGAANDEPDSSETTNVASSELLRALRCAAVNGLSSDGFGSVACFLSKYRVSVYSDESAVEICPKNAAAQSEGTEGEPKRKSSDKKMRNSTGYPNIDDGTDSMVSKTKPLSGPEENGPKRKSAKKKGDPAKGSVNLEGVNESLEGALGMTNGKTKLPSGDKATEEKDKPKRKSSKKKGTPIMSSPGKTLGSTKTEPLSGPSLAGDKTPEESNKPKRKSTKKKKGNPTKNESETLLDATLGTAKPQTDSLDMKTKSLSGLSDVKIISAGIGVSVKEALEKNRSLSHCKKAEHRIKKKKELSAEQTPTAIPDLNGIGAKPELSKDSNVVVIDAKPGNLVVDLHSPAKPNGQAVSESEPKKRKRKEKKTLQENIPDLNGTKEEPEQKKKKKPKRKDKIEVVLKYPKNKSLAGSTALLLTFAPGESSAPSAAEDLASAFRKFGPLKESETRVSKDSNGARVVFENASDAAEALRSLERDNPFGPGLVGFRLLTPPEPAAPPATAPPLDFIKQNLQMMTDMLEKSGDNLSQEMRAKLEEEIKGLLSKVSSMAGS